MSMIALKFKKQLNFTKPEHVKENTTAFKIDFFFYRKVGDCSACLRKDRKKAIERLKDVLLRFFDI